MRAQTPAMWPAAGDGEEPLALRPVGLRERVAHYEVGIVERRERRVAAEPVAEGQRLGRLVPGRHLDDRHHGAAQLAEVHELRGHGEVGVLVERVVGAGADGDQVGDRDDRDVLGDRKSRVAGALLLRALQVRRRDGDGGRRGRLQGEPSGDGHPIGQRGALRLGYNELAPSRP